jgi:pyridoxal phosphate enzyme (YggS family)
VETLATRLAVVRDRMARACARAGREPDEVALVAVAKGHGPDAVAEAFAAGAGIIGENRVQEAVQKQPLCPSGIEWHMIGHLQRNKVRHAVRIFQMIHSIDSWRLLEAVNAAVAEEGRTMPVCLEINVSGESSKHGIAPGEVQGVVERCEGLMNIDLVGLMTIPPFTPDPEDARPVFRRLRELRDELRDRTGFALEHLSMGMSHDVEVAIEEGSTLVRVGTDIFGARRRPVGGAVDEGEA